MPLYEYVCIDCHTKFEVLRRMGQADEPIACQQCNGQHTSRVLSVFAAVSRDSTGQTRSVAGGGCNCGGCSGGNCTSCSHH